MEAVAILAFIVGFLRGDGGTPEGALVVGGGWGVRAVVGVWIYTGVALNIRVKSFAAIGLVAQGGAS